MRTNVSPQTWVTKTDSHNAGRRGGPVNMPNHFYNLQETLLGEAATAAKGAGVATFHPPKQTPSGRFPRSVWNHALPKHITHLDLTWNTFDERYSVVVPDHVKWLNVSHTNYYHGVGFHVPNTLETLIHRGDYWGSIYAFPPGLKVLDLSDHHRLEWLPELPKTLELLKLTNCYNLKELPELPSTLRVLDIQNCRTLKELPDFPDSLEELWAGGADKLPDEIGFSFNYSDNPRWIRNKQKKQRETESRERQQKRCRALRQEIVAAAYHPKRVERWLEARGWDILEEMLG